MFLSLHSYKIDFVALRKTGNAYFSTSLTISPTILLCEDFDVEANTGV
jgi:hypothetical protein